MTAERVKLAKPGDALTIAVTACAKATTGTYPGIEFFGTDGGKQVVVEVPQSSADRQLGRLSLTYEGCVGKTLTFSRDPNAANAAKPFWGISLAAKPNGVANGTAKPALGPESGHIAGLDDGPNTTPAEKTNTEKLNDLARVQAACFTHALALANRAKDAGVTVTLEGLSALTAQLLIGHRGNGR